MIRRPPVVMIVAAGAIAVTTLALLCALAAGCGSDGLSGTPTDDGGSTMTTGTYPIPPIDRLAPISFETASFGFG